MEAVDSGVLSSLTADLIRGEYFNILAYDTGKFLSNSCVQGGFVFCDLRAEVHFVVRNFDSLPTDLLKQLPQGGTGIYMSPDFGHIRHELYDRHCMLGFVGPCLLPCAADTMSRDGFGLRELCFDLPLEITDDPRAKEVRVVHLLCSTSLDHLH